MEKCAKCLKNLGWRNLCIYQPLNEWLCLECGELFQKELEEFMRNFVQLERSKREDPNYWECDELDGKRICYTTVFDSEEKAKHWVKQNPESRSYRKIIRDAVL